MASKNTELKFIGFFLLILMISGSNFPENNIKSANAFDPNSYIVLSSYEYHYIAVNATIGEAFSGDWDVSPADVLSPPFLVFIIDSANFNEWTKSDNLTQAINRLPSQSIIYLYDPLFRIDDIPLDNRRSDGFNVKAPFADTWYLVMYAGATLIPLTFSWHISVINARLLDIVIYSIVGVAGIALIIVFTIVTLKRKKLTPEEEFKQIIEQEKKDEQYSKVLEEGDKEEEFSK